MATFQTDSLVEFYDNVYEHQCELIFLWTCQISQTESYLSSEKRRKRNNYRKWEAVIYSRFERIWTMFAIIFQSHFPLWNHPIISVSIKEDDIHEPIKLHGFLHNVGYFFFFRKEKEMIGNRKSSFWRLVHTEESVTILSDESRSMPTFLLSKSERDTRNEAVVGLNIFICISVFFIWGR